MFQIDYTFLVLLVLAAVCYFSNNHTVTLAILILLIFKVTPLAQYFPQLNKYGVTLGIIILTAAILVPLANGSIAIQSLLKSLVNWPSVLAIAVGILVSWLGMRGVNLMGHNPMIVNGLIVGTLIGVSFFNGLAVGPVIAAGLLSLLMGKF
ncbi:DUF441 domain-containing protein [Utexia brackfieldae]|uniref:DUF441 domain-containing protein n=1 Tax=Utexia brackfieldae TaxID=3074108 RepID=UPI00370D5F2E